MIFALLDNKNKKIVEFLKNYFLRDGLTVKIFSIQNIIEELKNKFFGFEVENIIAEKILEDNGEEKVKQIKEFSKEKIDKLFKEGLENIKPTFISEILISEIESDNSEIKIIDDITVFEVKFLKRYFGDDLIIIKFENENNSSVVADYDINSNKKDIEIYAELNKILNRPKLLINKEKIKKLSNLKKYIPLKKEEIKEIKKNERLISEINKTDLKKLKKELKYNINISEKEEKELLEYLLYKFLKCKKEGLSYKATVLNCLGLKEKDLGILTYIYLFKLNKAIEIFLSNNELPEVNIDFHKYEEFWNNNKNKLEYTVKIFDDFLNENKYLEEKELLPKYIVVIKQIFDSI